MTSPPNKGFLRRLGRAPWLRAVFAFRFVAAMVVVTGATGLFLHGLERFGGLSWGLAEWAHIVVGWFAVPWTLGYLVHHLARRWGSFGEFYRILGLLLALSLCLALVSGLLLDLVPGAEGWSGVLAVHYFLTFPILALLLLHPSRIARRKLARWARGVPTPDKDAETS